MPKIVSVSTVLPPHEVKQEQAVELTRSLFSQRFKDIERLLKVFQNGDIEKRDVCMPIEWYGQAHDFEERNELYIHHAVNLGVDAVKACLQNPRTLEKPVDPSEIDAIFFISSTGISTPSIDARIMNLIPFRDDTRRIPIWGLGCAGGAAGVSRAFEYCKAFPKSNVLVLSVEFCSLTFQKDDYSKSNLVGVSLFSDGVACALITGDQSEITVNRTVPAIIGTTSKLMPASEDVMGWDIKNNGLYVVFSKSIPAIITNWLGPFVHEFLASNNLTKDDITHFIAHPGGKKVLMAYEAALRFDSSKTAISREVLRNHGNMSSPTILYVLKQFMESSPEPGEYGLMAALGPGFCGELLLLKWD
ncbi:3-oxoacyl-[acyl-carrier-protein] synthase III C-terminal domain-containing protein [Sporosarcina thermotolerans]|uniref:3-oxoacyl-[acyl-carrier-protein] synthase III C-terminal domain-containing protein n=1 Tax=Sporosarcina thermotolerans TaxID=633404 RepID=A0AAW9A617_9BACL|nr:3-oxoacyl-[acyl-carrier-protein] synthase III C-terminal domain-containing protein [Sporosarcina thermotolerans]MDW0116018.1 3-oxoacyl-[acyl-carrier-protein] synthase III C-terminal domain-containing protein [Sporosarcina thermotolerans]